MYVCVYAYECVCVFVYVYASVFACVYSSAFASVHALTHVNIYIYTCAHELPQMERLIIASIFAILPLMLDNIKRGRIVRLSDLSNHM